MTDVVAWVMDQPTQMRARAYPGLLADGQSHGIGFSVHGYQSQPQLFVEQKGPNCLALRRTLDVQFSEVGSRTGQDNIPAVKGSPWWAVSSMAKTPQHRFGPDLSIGLLQSRIERYPSLPTPILA